MIPVQLLYVHRDHKDYEGWGTQDGHSTSTQLLSSDFDGDDKGLNVLRLDVGLTY